MLAKLFVQTGSTLEFGESNVPICVSLLRFNDVDISVNPPPGYL